MAGLREQNKALRREAILDATLRLLGEHHPSEITTSQIAALADVSAATVFNLIGTREDILTALGAQVVDALLDALAELEVEANVDPIAAARLIVDASVATFTANSTAYRRVLSEIAFSYDVGRHADFDPARLQEAAIREAQKRGILDDRFDPAGLGKQIFASYSAALLARHGLLAVLAATANDTHRGAFRDELVELSSRLASLSQPEHVS